MPLTAELDGRLHTLMLAVGTGTGPGLAERFACSARTIQRALTESLGHGPTWISRRIRLQEVALALATRPIDDLAAIATEPGYSDQSHLTSDFRATTGITPHAYRQAVGRIATRGAEPPARPASGTDR